jgi:putative hydrolase of HD superfamily
MLFAGSNFKFKEIDMKHIANLLFEANHLKKISRSGFAFLGTGKESVGEHIFSTTFIAYIMTQLEPSVDALRLISMCLVHDLPETRTGDINYFQKKYVTADTTSALADMVNETTMDAAIADLVSEFDHGESFEAKLAKDADQIALILELKTLADIGSDPPKKWLPHVLKRLQTDTGKQLAENIIQTDWDAWWLKNYVDR